MIRMLVALLAFVAVAAPAHAQTYPAKPIRLIVPFTPGGGTDFVSRVVATELAKSTGWTVVVENKAGAAGTIGLIEAARANAEATTSMGQADNMIIAPAVRKTSRSIRSDRPRWCWWQARRSADDRYQSGDKTLTEVIAAAKATRRSRTARQGMGRFRIWRSSFCNRRAISRWWKSRTRAPRRRCPTSSAVTSRWLRCPSRRACRTSRRASCADSP